MSRALRFRRRLTVAGICVLCILFLAFYYAFRSATQSEGMNHWVAHTQEVLGTIAQERLNRAWLKNEVWGYRETHDPGFRQRFQEDRRRLDEAMKHLQQLTADNPLQQGLLAELTLAISSYELLLENSMQRSALGGAADSGSTAESLIDGQLDAQVRQLFENLESNERTLLASRSQAVSVGARQTRYVILLSGLLSFSILIVAGHLIQREIMTRERIEDGLQTAQELLGVKYHEQRAELGNVMEGLHAQIRARQNAEGVIRRLNEDLEDRVRLRTAELEEVNRELEAFTYSVSHDLRAPLRHMEGFSRLLQKDHADQLSTDARHYLDRIQSAATHMSSLVEDLLHLSRIGRQVPQRNAISLRALAEEVRAELTQETEGRLIDWKISPLPEVQGDPLLVRQVLFNLFSNAVKFTGKQDRAIIEIGSKDENGETVISVRDNGAGFDPRYADKLFGVFQRLHRQDEFEGTGIGLALVQRIIHKHGGRVWADSLPDQGATFYFTLPARAESRVQTREMAGARA
ncbi:MAG: ATP-binding protein [Candidatus Acidiferrales bacterium]